MAQNAQYAKLLGNSAQSINGGAIFAAADEAAANLLNQPRFKNRRRYFLVGSGDSLFAAQSALPAIRRWSGLDVRVQTSIEFARYELPLAAAEQTAVLIAVSNSSGSSRTREGVELARAADVPTLAVVGSLDGPLAKTAELILHRPVALTPDAAPDWAPRIYLNMIEYLAALLALYGLGLALGRETGRLSVAEVRQQQSNMSDAVAMIGRCAASVEPQIIAFLAATAAFDTAWVLGAGPSLGSAYYSAAKFHEQVPLNGIPQDLEEWAHLQYFLTLSWARRGPVIVLAPQGNSADRAQEIMQGIHNAGGRGVLVTDADLDTPSALTLQLPTAGGGEWLSPITFHLPCQLIAMHLANQAGVDPTPLRRQDDYWLIRKGRIETDPGRLA